MPGEEDHPDPSAPAISALERSIPVLACPICGGELRRGRRALRCDIGHTFDIARQGYASFTTGGGPHHQGDTASMIAARRAFLATGHYSPIADAVIAATSEAAADDDRWLVELAGGTGYYAGRVLDARPGLYGVTLDVSKYAARAAAHSHPRLASVTGDAHAVLPFHSGGVGLVLSVFGPRRGVEVARILSPGGVAIVVTPQPHHLVELRDTYSLLAIGADKEARLQRAMEPLVPAGTTTLEYPVKLSPSQVVDSIMMGPNAFHRDADDIRALSGGAADQLREATVAVTISRFR